MCMQSDLFGILPLYWVCCFILERRVGKLPPKSPSAPVITTTSRFNALDAQRGLIMVLMAVDHASYFIARVHSAEFWGVTLPSYPNAFWFLTRWITHLCAPGFFLLMGAGMALFGVSRLKAGWSENRITGFFATRGVLLILLQFSVENPAWSFGDKFAAPGVMTFRGGIPGAGSGEDVYFGVLYALGGAMIFWALIRRTPSWFIALISLTAILLTQAVTPERSDASFPYSPILRVLIIPGYTNGWVVFYPAVPWLGVTGLGLLFGRLMHRKPFRAGTGAAWIALGSTILFILVRSLGAFGNLNVVPPGWMGFLNVVKYPPSLAFLAITLALNLALISGWMLLKSTPHSRFHPLLVFGRTPLFFYLLHLWLFALLGLLFTHGSSLAAMFLVWLLAMCLLYPLCFQYARFKTRKPVASLWRFL
jgi:uncharacterized membrane protein